MPLNQSVFLSLSSLFMGVVFAYSASVQLNDHDWYFWFPLYSLASGINLLHLNFTWKAAINRGALLVLSGGALLLVKVLVEAELQGPCGLWCVDMQERAVREKMGSGLVVISMSLRLMMPAASTKARGRTGKEAQNLSYFVLHGFAIIVALTFFLCLYFFLFVRPDIKLHSEYH